LAEFPLTVGNQTVDGTKTEYKLGRVYINDTQYFGNVPELVWDFYIGGYQPAQKWLKDRKGRVLTHEDITHYQQNPPRNKSHNAADRLVIYWWISLK